MWNDDQWTGDYLSEGIVGITFDAFSEGPEPVDLRFAFNGAGGWFMTSRIRIDDFAPGPDLTSFLLPITESDLIHVTGGTGDYADTMGGVARMEIISATGTPTIGNVSTVLRGDIVDTTLRIDNIRAIPEPSAFALVALGAAASGLRRRRWR